MIYWQLFCSFLQIGAFSFGGGYAALPLIQNQVVTGHGWLSLSEFTDLITLSQMTPGPIALNAATFVGIRIAGLPGAVAATLGCVLPSCLIVTAIALFYTRRRGQLDSVLQLLRPAVVALIASAGLSILVSSFWGARAIGLSTIRWKAVALFALCLVLLFKKKNPICVMLAAGALNLLLGLITGAVP